MAKLRLLHFTR